MLIGAIVSHNHLRIVDKQLEGFGDALEKWVVADAVRFERYLRTMIVPQLVPDCRYVHGLHYLFESRTHHELRIRLLLEWFDDLMATGTSESWLIAAALMDAPAGLTRDAVARVDELIALSPPGWRGESQAEKWLALRLLRDFKEALPDLEKAAQEPTFLWELQSAMGFSFPGEEHMRNASPDALAWIFGTFDASWPYAEHPGSSEGSRNPWDATRFLQAVLFKLAEDTSVTAMQALHTLREKGSSSYGEALRAAYARQRAKITEADFVAPDLEAIASALRESVPRTIADVRAIVLDAIADLQRRIAGSSTDTVNLFYHKADGFKPKDEGECRNALLDLLGQELPFGIHWAPEEHMPRGKRVDAGFRLGQMRLPMEAKLAWNSKLWRAASDQLDRLYASADHLAGGLGVYVVFWFGRHGKPIPLAPGGVRPTSADELERMLRATLFDGTAERLAIVVIDLEHLK